MTAPLVRIPPCACGGTRFESGPAPEEHQTVEGALVYWHRCRSCGFISRQEVPVVSIVEITGSPIDPVRRN